MVTEQFVNIDVNQEQSQKQSNFITHVLSHQYYDKCMLSFGLKVTRCLELTS